MKFKSHSIYGEQTVNKTVDLKWYAMHTRLLKLYSTFRLFTGKLISIKHCSVYEFHSQIKSCTNDSFNVLQSSCSINVPIERRHFLFE